MPEMNPIVETLIRIAQLKQQDEALAQRKEEAKAGQQFEMEKLAQADRVNKLLNRYRDTQSEFEKAKIELEIQDKFREQVAGGLRKIQGAETIPQGIPTYMQGLLPKGSVPYDLSPEDIAQPEAGFQPFSTQIVKGPFGDIPVEDVVSYPEAQQMKLKGLRDVVNVKAIENYLTTLAQEKAKAPNIQSQIEGRKDVAQIAADQRETTAAANRVSNELIAGIRANATLEAAKLRRTNTLSASDEMLGNLAESVALGEIKLPAGNNGVAVNNTLKQSGLVVPNSANLAKVPFSQTMLQLVDRINSNIIPRLATGQTGAKITGIISSVWPTDLKNEFDAIELDATSAAREAGEKGNFSNTDIGRALKALGDKGITQEQARRRLQILREKVNSKLINESLGGLPEKQRIAILNKYEIDPSTITVQSKGSTIKKYKQSEGSWYVYSPTRNQYEVIE